MPPDILDHPLTHPAIVCLANAVRAPLPRACFTPQIGWASTPQAARAEKMAATTSPHKSPQLAVPPSPVARVLPGQGENDGVSEVRGYCRSRRRMACGRAVGVYHSRNGDGDRAVLAAPYVSLEPLPSRTPIPPPPQEDYPSPLRKPIRSP